MEKLDKMRVVLTQGDLSQAGAGLDGARVRSWCELNNHFLFLGDTARGAHMVTLSVYCLGISQRREMNAGPVPFVGSNCVRPVPSLVLV